MDNNINLIVQIMNEQVGQYGIIDPTVDQSGQQSNCPYKGFDNDELKLAARYVQLIGCPERAKELLEKVVEVSETLNAEGLDDAVIDEISKVTPTQL